jgi:hypothetical protein
MKTAFITTVVIGTTLTVAALYSAYRARALWAILEPL